MKQQRKRQGMEGLGSLGRRASDTWWFGVIGAGLDAVSGVVERPDRTLAAASAFESTAPNLKVAQDIGDHVAMAAEHDGSAGERTYVGNRAGARGTFEEFWCNLYLESESLSERLNRLDTSDGRARIDRLDVVTGPLGSDCLRLVAAAIIEFASVIERVEAAADACDSMTDQKQRHDETVSSFTQAAKRETHSIALQTDIRRIV